MNLSKDYYRKLRRELQEQLSKSRYEHTLGVEFTAASLAMCYEYDIDKARIAGLLHDCAKCIDDDKKLDECITNGIYVTPVEMRTGYLLHSKLGAFYAKKIYNIDDKEILDAILYHTTGRPGMTLLEKIIFVADYIEPSRDKAPNLTNLRKLAFININLCVELILHDTIEYLKDTGEEIDETSLLTYEYYKEKENNKHE
ncbi:MAG: HD domain-containing protein [Clostridiales bacterium]|nr:HD domain-containing protein [Clostridiales bacterium]